MHLIFVPVATHFIGNLLQVALTVLYMAVARNLCAGGRARGTPVTPVSRGVWGHGPPENFEI